MLIVDLNGGYVLSSRAQPGYGEPLDLDLTSRKALPEDFPWRKNLGEGRAPEDCCGPIRAS